MRPILRLADKAAAALVALIGLVHLAVGRAAFTDPNERRIWFASAGFLLIVTGLANLAAARLADRAVQLAALAGAAALLILAALIARADPDLLRQPQTIALIALGAFLTLRRVQSLGRRGRF
jgi:sulfite exporter TauE/SafE